MGKTVKCRFCKREIFLNNFRSHLQVMHPNLVKEKMPIERVESLNDSTLLLMFTMMEMLHEVPPMDGGEIIQEEKFEGKSGEFGGAGASGNWGEEKCDAKCESCNLHEKESEPDSDNDNSDDNSNSDNE